MLLDGRSNLGHVPTDGMFTSVSRAGKAPADQRVRLKRVHGLI